MKSWLEGKKTYIAAVLVAAVTIVLVGLGKLSPAAATTVGLLAASVFAATYRAAIERHHEEVLATMVAVSEAGADLAHHNMPGALKAGEAAAQSGLRLVQEVKAETAESQTGATS